jgi:hypothetical protein
MAIQSFTELCVSLSRLDRFLSMEEPPMPSHDATSHPARSSKQPPKHHLPADAPNGHAPHQSNGLPSHSDHSNGLPGHHHQNRASADGAGIGSAAADHPPSERAREDLNGATNGSANGGGISTKGASNGVSNGATTTATAAGVALDEDGGGSCLPAGQWPVGYVALRGECSGCAGYVGVLCKL